MKINFAGYFKDVLKIVNSPTTAAPSIEGGFARLLSDIAPKSTQPNENIAANREPKAQTQISDGTTMARYKFSEPMATPPSVDLGRLDSAPSGVNGMTLTIKPPTVIEAKRVPSKSNDTSRNESSDMHSVVDLAGRKEGVDPALSLAVAKAESSFNPKAVSDDGHYSKGLFQLLDSTGKELHSKLEVQGHYDPFNPTLNAELGTNYLRHLHDIFSQSTELPNSLSTIAAANSSSLEKLAVAAFNAGEGRVASAQARAKRAGLNASEYSDVETYLPDSTQDYVKRVLKFRDEYSTQSQG